MRHADRPINSGLAVALTAQHHHHRAAWPVEWVVRDGTGRHNRGLTLAQSRQSVPRYERIKQHILDRIASGKWGPDVQVPTEHELAERFEVSRMTVNRAVRELTDEGFLFRIAGVGTFVADRRTRAHPLEIRNVSEDVRSRGRSYRAEVVELTEIAADAQLAAQFGVLVDTPLFRSIVIHHEDGLAIQLEDRYVNPAIAPEYLHADFTQRTPDEYLMSIAPLQGAEHILRAVMPNSLSHRLLKISETEPCLLVVRRTWSNKQVASYAEICHPGSRYELTAHFVPEDNRGSIQRLQIVDGFRPEKKKRSR